MSKNIVILVLSFFGPAGMQLSSCASIVCVSSYDSLKIVRVKNIPEPVEKKGRFRLDEVEGNPFKWSVRLP